ncbi:hypothetical protein ACFQS7_20115 [Dankookia sp. GCM10030260]|uniref:hypothetical protein n=1 Tax=Dankookia sp. GCM10030260 TaxID=3273390 RepID=UPI00362294DE
MRAEPRGTYPERLESRRKVTGWPVFTPRPRAAVAAAWRAQMMPQLHPALAVPLPQPGLSAG